MKNLIHNKFLQIDNILLDVLSIKIKNTFFDRLMPKITHWNDYGQIYIITSIILWKDNLTNLLNIFLALTLGLLSGEGFIKYLFKRERPLVTPDNYCFLIKFPNSSSFPSGHTTSSFAVLGVTWYMDLQYKYVILVLAVVISFSRVYLHVHYPSDIIGGILLGFICAMITIKMPECLGMIQSIFSNIAAVLSAYVANYQSLQLFT
ncbi:MAG: phosphatase PAP2 family protein [Peptococcaceae bacterium]|nr:phosphatase PAP2 family protein [Peptococcaceae bacterium]